MPAEDENLVVFRTMETAANRFPSNSLNVLFSALYVQWCTIVCHALKLREVQVSFGVSYVSISSLRYDLFKYGLFVQNSFLLF